MTNKQMQERIRELERELTYAKAGEAFKEIEFRVKKLDGYISRMLSYEEGFEAGQKDGAEYADGFLDELRWFVKEYEQTTETEQPANELLNKAYKRFKKAIRGFE